MSRPVPIVPEVLLLGTLPNPGDLERSIRLQLTPGSGPAPEMAMAAAGAPGRSGLDIGGGLVVSDPSTGLSADVRVRVRMLLAKPPGSGNEGVSVSLSYSDARSTQPSPHGLAAGGGLADAPSAPAARSRPDGPPHPRAANLPAYPSAVAQTPRPVAGEAHPRRAPNFPLTAAGKPKVRRNLCATHRNVRTLRPGGAHAGGRADQGQFRVLGYEPKRRPDVP